MPRPVRSECGMEAAIQMIGGKWKLMLLWRLTTGPRRFGELRRLVRGISEKILVQQLRELEADRLITRHDFGEVPPRVEYALSPLGRSLCDALQPLCDWGVTHRDQIEAQPAPAT